MNYTERSKVLELERYIHAYILTHGVPPAIDLYVDRGIVPNEERHEYVWIRHHPDVMGDDQSILAHIERDLPLWTANLAGPWLIRKLAPVNTREVFAYELQSSEGSQ